ncbi:uncharacterized protein Z518_01797 [Rhinocladiella mackenziei CBS 650.93]|uniref:Rhinocladiella mackenziei CBS 650.93 unplaced genomic scaffold supercont1.1, whole genome shotgun sequence n=1 Tax=Rhinocladiella mackenziei CBS 650.93 TaxID=1442369 RepID=A0A0D2HJ63_9EURO|nr:uncharacterized protein Z518_01797 [Rhinocladiella mackenziei CBS 650.93]KIX10713.1 hypothetical protein Z518_01797 [Rhinocladiella mackenziei CBS 650.93]
MDRYVSDLQSRDDGFNFKLYRYVPSLPAAIIFVVIFATLTALHTWRLYRSRALYFTAFTIGGLFETIGYCGRIWSHYDNQAIGGFVMQAILILVAPALFAASVYMILGRLIRAIRAEHLSLLPVRRLTTIFVVGDVISFTLQAAGGGIQSAGTLNMFNIGEKIIVVGLCMQIAFFGFFVVTVILFYQRIRAHPTPEAQQNEIPWRRHVRVLFAVSIIILVRSVVRVVEYLQGNDGYLIAHEIFLYIFDATLMVAVMTILLVYYVSDLKIALDRIKATSSPLRSDYLMDTVRGGDGS